MSVGVQSTITRAQRRLAGCTESGAKRGFTLIEVILSIGVISLLVSILLPALGRARDVGRGAACAASLHQAGLAVACYLDDNDGTFFPYFQDVPSPGGGRRWWFGFEKGGPAINPNQRNRPLDKAAGFLGKYMGGSWRDFVCPAFPYEASGYVRKFGAPAGGYGYNTEGLAGFGIPGAQAVRARKIQEFVGRTSDVFALADGIHFDRLTLSGSPPMKQGFNEPPYIQWQSETVFNTTAGVNGGYGHFRHAGRANVLYLDGHASGQLMRGNTHPFSVKGLGTVGNLSDELGRKRDVVRFPETQAVRVDVVYGL